MYCFKTTLPDNHVHDQAVPHQPHHADNHVHHYDGDLQTTGEEILLSLIWMSEVVMKQRLVVQLKVSEVDEAWFV